MFNPSQLDVRNFFFNVYQKHTEQQILTDLEKIALSVIFEHPEYEKFLKNKDKYLTYQWVVDNNETNPFLHLSMHMTILEQVSINQPFGIKTLYNDLCKKFETTHNAEHELMDCIAEMLWQAQKNNSAPDQNIYFECIQQKLN